MLLIFMTACVAALIANRLGWLDQPTTQQHDEDKD